MKRTVVIATILCSGLLLGGNMNSEVFAQKQILKQSNTVQEVKSLTKEEALNALINHNNKLNYQYQGDENAFKILKKKGLKGYVFLPDIPTDFGYFIDKETKEIYYFHPNGYLELIK